MNLTDSARSRLEGYLGEVRAGLAGRSDVDAEEVVAGIREHIETDLDMAGRSAVVTEAELNAVLARLGPPEAVAGVGDASGAATSGGVPPAGVTALTLGFLGAVLVLAGVWPAVGWLGLITGAILARFVVDGPAPPPTDSAIGALLRVYRVAAAVAFVVVLVLGPAVLVWTLAQTGGPLAAPAAAAGDGGIASYVRWVVAGAGMVSGAWWLLLGLLLSSFGDAARRAFGSASYLLPKRGTRVLLLAGAAVLLLSTLVWIT